MRHEISATEAAAIHKARERRCICAEMGATGTFQFHTLCPVHAAKAAEQAELDAHQSKMELLYKTQ